MYRRRTFFVILFFWHHLIALAACYYVLQNGGDALQYWFTGTDLSAASWGDYLNPGTDFIRFFTFPFVKYLNLPLWAGFLMFSVLSFPAVWLLFRMLWQVADGKKIPQVLAVLLMLLPNFHFWTGIIGKEVPVVTALVVFLYEVHRRRYRSLLLMLSVVVLALIRPHVSFILVVSYVISLMLTGTLPRRLMLAAAGITVLLTSVFTVILLQLQDFTGGFGRVIRKYEAHIRYFQTTDSYVPLDEYALLLKFFTFYFRPLPGEKEGLLYAITGAENMLVLLLMLFAGYVLIRKFRSMRKSMLVVLPLVFLFLFGMMYVFAYANYGIIMRSKVMALPFISLFVLQSLKSQSLNDKRQGIWLR
ncbi:hypothetical protein CO230_01545 [Chryseobacterium sp. 6424]|uniref:hypothetical protein n=1 Tax=Chryseobacterium sp. 6424 TaxID=2039166 RepID=UPI000EFB93AA|nr:hypothetical protein [Chryseobacterium sp. 6424]AYO56927.1 hypothetical protein CO230_01545 [Chryseobacterium sp. 6424]